MKRLYGALVILAAATGPVLAQPRSAPPVMRAAPVMRAPMQPITVHTSLNGLHPVMPLYGRPVMPAVRPPFGVPYTVVPRAFGVPVPVAPRAYTFGPTLRRALPVERGSTFVAAPAIPPPSSFVLPGSRAFLPPGTGFHTNPYGFGTYNRFGFPFYGFAPFFSFGASYVYIPNAGLVPNIATAPYYGYGPWSPYYSPYGPLAPYGPYAPSPFSMPYYTATPYGQPFNGTFVVPYPSSLYTGESTCSAADYATSAESSNGCSASSNTLVTTGGSSTAANPLRAVHVKGTIIRNADPIVTLQLADKTRVPIDVSVAEQLGEMPASMKVGTVVDVLGYFSGDSFIATEIH